MIRKKLFKTTGAALGLLAMLGNLTPRWQKKTRSPSET